MTIQDRIAKYSGRYGFYTESDMDSMRAECCSHEYDKLVGSGDLCDILYEGVVGWKEIIVDEVIEYWEDNILPDTVDEDELLKMENATGVGK